MSAAVASSPLDMLLDRLRADPWTRHQLVTVQRTVGAAIHHHYVDLTCDTTLCGIPAADPRCWWAGWSRRLTDCWTCERVARERKVAP